jgi:hypothetical protein
LERYTVLEHRNPGPDRKQRFRLCLTIPPPPAPVHGASSSWTATRPTPKWILATVATPGDVRPADPAAVLADVTAAWVATATGLYRPALTRLRHADVWRIDEQPQEN